MYKRERIIGYEEYEVDTNGAVYSKKGKPLKFSHNHKGYQIVNLLVKGRRRGFSVHTLVAKQFIDNSDPSKTQVNHKDGNKDNNSVDNLEWVTPKENTWHSRKILGYNNSGKNNPNAKKVVGINKKNHEEILSFDSIADAIRYFQDISGKKYVQYSLWRALHGERKSYKGYVWKYLS